MTKTKYMSNASDNSDNEEFCLHTVRSKLSQPIIIDIQINIATVIHATSKTVIKNIKIVSIYMHIECSRGKVMTYVTMQ